MILTIRTDKPDAEVGLFTGDAQVAYEVWPAHRALAAQLHQKIEQLLHSQNAKLQDLTGIVCFAGPGSFTGLRIGLTVANALAYGLTIPIVAMQDPSWIQQGMKRLRAGEQDTVALPFYGAPVHITPPRQS